MVIINLGKGFENIGLVDTRYYSTGHDQTRGNYSNYIKPPSHCVTANHLTVKPFGFVDHHFSLAKYNYCHILHITLVFKCIGIIILLCSDV